MSGQHAISVDLTLKRPTFTLNTHFESEAGITALHGPSGSGKSTIIRLIAGLERPDCGTIRIGNTCVFDSVRGINIPPHKRRIGLVFQDAHLLPHLTVQANLTYGRWFTAVRERRIDFDAVVAVLGIRHLLDRKPATLSGGERQRVAIGRALLSSPRLLLMDEPLSSLDADRKLEILPFIEHLRDAFGIPMVYVSHALEELARLADHVVRLENGRIIAHGSPAQVLLPDLTDRYTDRFAVLSMLGGVVGETLAGYGLTTINHPAGQLVVPGKIGESGTCVRILIRATNVALAIRRPSNVSIRTMLAGVVTRVDTDTSPFAMVTIQLEGGDTLRASITRLAVDRLGIGEGDAVHALIKTATIDERGIPGQNAFQSGG